MCRTFTAIVYWEEDVYVAEDQVWHPCPKSPEDWEKLPDLIQDQLKKQAES